MPYRKNKAKKIDRVRGGKGGGKLASSGGAYIPSEPITVAYKRKPRLKAMDMRLGGVIHKASPNKVLRIRKKS